MAQSLSRVILHIVFSTKDRFPFINSSIRLRLHAYLATVVRDMKSHAYRIGGTKDHIHIACTLPRTISQSELLKKLKTTSSKWIKDQGVNNFFWQKGFGVFSVGQSQLVQLIEYIDKQETHHSSRGFQEEFRELLKKYNIEYNESYIWD